jgi:two-component system, OmpR family, catabolic regulation response regulator CreB
MGSILLVEPDPATSDAWADAIAASGHSVLTASGIREAWTVIRDGGFDVVVVDVYDPGSGVVDLALGMNALPDAPPIILVSESPAAPWISVRIGASTLVPKPCDPDEVVSAVNRLLWRVRPLPVWDDPRETTRRRSIDDVPMRLRELF